MIVRVLLVVRTIVMAISIGKLNAKILINVDSYMNIHSNICNYIVLTIGLDKWFI